MMGGTALWSCAQYNTVWVCMGLVEGGARADVVRVLGEAA